MREFYKCFEVSYGALYAGLTRAQAGSTDVHLTRFSAWLGTAVTRPWRRPPWATDKRVDSDRGSQASCQGMHHRIQEYE